ncbi:MAG: BrnT family toxin [Candidatus Competibacteraceae bacterium]
MEFEWNQAKADANLRRHGVSFNEATTVFADWLSRTVPDPDHSFGEDRFLTFGVSVNGRALVVSHVERGNKIRIISVRPLTRHEQRAYEDG